MNLCKKVFFTLSLLLTGVASQANSKPHICFFEMGQSKASDNLKAKAGSENIMIYKIKKGEKAKQTFEKMIKNNKNCAGLVFSGHHWGNWTGGGHTLSLKDMEELSCRPEYRDWFKQVKAIYLDGCYTATDNVLKKDKGTPSPDSESVRVLQNIIEEKRKEGKVASEPKRSVRIHSQAYTAVLDKNTPFSSRYLRMFPETQVYGFSGAAPTGGGGKDKDQVGHSSWIFNHLSDLGKALSAEKATNSLKEQFKQGFDLLFNSDYCDPETSKEAWENVTRGQARTEAIEHQEYQESFRLACALILAKQVLDNPDSESARTALARHIANNPDSYKDNKEILELANKILNGSNSKEAVKLAKKAIVQTLQTINEKDKEIKEGDKKISHLLFNNIYDTWITAKKYKSRDQRFYRDVLQEFKKDSFNDSLKERIASDHTSSLRKGDYIKFWTEIHDVNINGRGQKAKFARDHIQMLVDKAARVFEGLRSPRKSNLSKEARQALALSVVDQLLQYNFLSQKQMEDLINNKELFPPGDEKRFIASTHIILKLKAKPDEIVSTVKTEKRGNRKQFAIQMGAREFLRSGREPDREKLEELAQNINYTDLQQDGYSFLKALHNYVKHKQDKPKVLYQLLDEDTAKEEGMESLVFAYACLYMTPSDRNQVKDLAKKHATAHTKSHYMASSHCKK